MCPHCYYVMFDSTRSVEANCIVFHGEGKAQPSWCGHSPNVGLEHPGSESCLHYSVFLEGVAQWIKCYEMSPWLLVSMLMLLWGFLSLFLFVGELRPPMLQTSSANQTWRAIQPINVDGDYPSCCFSITGKGYQKLARKQGSCVVVLQYIYILTSTSV